MLFGVGMLHMRHIVCQRCPNLQVPDKDEFSQSKRQMLASIDVAMGGKVAEEVIFGNDAVTSGSTSDLKHATQLARHMVTECGRSEELGKFLMALSFCPSPML